MKARKEKKTGKRTVIGYLCRYSASSSKHALQRSGAKGPAIRGGREEKQNDDCGSGKCSHSS